MDEDEYLDEECGCGTTLVFSLALLPIVAAVVWVFF